jgi:hypothetical protein
MMAPMDHHHCFQELLCISKKLLAGNIPVPNAALQVEWLYMTSESQILYLAKLILCFDSHYCIT